MSDQLPLKLRGAPPARITRNEWLDGIEAAWLRVLQPEAKSTRRTYLCAWRSWADASHEVGASPLPIAPNVLIGYLEHLSKTLAPNTIRVKLAALSSIDALSRRTPSEPHPMPLAHHPAVANWLKNWSREHPRAPRKRARALTALDLLTIVKTAQERGKNQCARSHILSYARDRAILTIGTTGGLRSDDTVTLNLSDVEVTPRGLLVTIRRSKTDQEGQGKMLSIFPQRTALLCPVDAWQAWLNLRAGAGGEAAFTAIARGGELTSERLTTRSIDNIVRRRAERAGFEGVSSHSLRRSMATLARENGQRLEHIMRHGRWKSLQTMEGYISQRELFDDSPTGGLLDVDS